jgi:succinate dehydrogenase / fumarate reductase cytochrome b subunit
MGKLMVAVTGVALVLFVLAHLAGVAMALVQPHSFELYAAALHRQPWLPLLELSLAMVLLAHPIGSLVRRFTNALCRGPGPFLLVSRRGAGERPAALAARAMPWSGGVLLAFLVVHLLQLRWHRPPEGQELAVLLALLQSPLWLNLYVLAGLALALHLFHGGESAHRSLGLLDPASARGIRLATRSLALLVGGGFALMPIALLLGATWAGELVP